MSGIFRGVGVALVTPFADNGEVDYVSLERLVNHVVAGGIDYVVALGTTGETPTLSHKEHKIVFESIKSFVAGRVPVVIGIGGNSTAAVIDAFGEFDLKGVEAILSVAPYYNKPTQEGLFRHYSAIADKAPKPVLLYNIPSRTGVNISPETILRLARYSKNIAGVKEACGDVGQFERILNERPDGFAVVSGDDGMTLPLIKLGGDGVISVMGNLFPSYVKAMTRKALDGRFDEAAWDWDRVDVLGRMLFEEGNPTGIKAALAAKGVLRNNLRLPLIPSSEQLYTRIRTEIDSLSNLS